MDARSAKAAAARGASVVLALLALPLWGVSTEKSVHASGVDPDSGRPWSRIRVVRTVGLLEYIERFESRPDPDGSRVEAYVLRSVRLLGTVLLTGLLWCGAWHLWRRAARAGTGASD